MNDVERHIRNLKSEKPYVRLHAAWALGEFGDASVVPSLVKTLRDEDVVVRIYAVEALGKISDASAVPVFVKTLGDEDAAMRARVVWALEKMVKKADTVEKAEKIEVMLKDGGAALAKKDRNVEAMMGIAKVMNEVADRKNELASKRDILLKDKPKPPKRGKVYQRMRVRNG